MFSIRPRACVLFQAKLQTGDEASTCNTSVIYLVQNLFPKGKESRTISINAQYMVLFKNPRDNTQVVNLAKQMYPGRVKYMQDAFRDQRPYLTATYSWT